MNHQSLVEHIPGLRRYARALTADAWAADDLVQDTLERACSRWRLWLAGTDLRAWLFTVMHNIYTNGVRRAVRQQQSAPIVAWDDAVHAVAAPDTATDTQLDLQRCLLQLPEEQRCVLLLVTLEDMAYADVARITGTPIGTVMSRLSRARTRLQALLDAPASQAQSSNRTGTGQTAAVVRLHSPR
jgi:RNA polymerase sigma-70 factor (ECF subfamily)